MSKILVKTEIPGLSEANSIMSKIKQIGIQDVELMFDKDPGMWAVCQVFRPSGKILVLGSEQGYATVPQIMWWCKTNEGTFRLPNDQDLSDIVTTVKRSEIIFEKGNDWMIKQIEDKENADYAANKKKQSDRIKSFAKPMKKAIKEELL